MQIRQPIERAVDEARAAILIGWRFEPVGRYAEVIRKAELDAARGEHEQEQEAPEAEHAVQLPREAPPADTPPRGPRSVLCVVDVTKWACGTGLG